MNKFLLRSVFNFFIVSLAASDLISALICPLHVYQKLWDGFDYWEIGTFLCKVNQVVWQAEPPWCSDWNLSNRMVEFDSYRSPTFLSCISHALFSLPTNRVFLLTQLLNVVVGEETGFEIKSNTFLILRQTQTSLCQDHCSSRWGFNAAEYSALYFIHQMSQAPCDCPTELTWSTFFDSVCKRFFKLSHHNGQTAWLR